LTDKKDPHPELAELHKKLLMMERNRKQQQDETEKIIRKQESRIEELKNEQRALKQQLQDLDQTQRPYSALKKTESSKELDEKIENEKKKDRELTLNIKTFKEEILKKRKILGGINAAQENYAQIQKQIKILENRLDKANQKFNEA
jgi:DNA repair exonuclease SbcCD ATPase subunit